MRQRVLAGLRRWLPFHAKVLVFGDGMGFDCASLALSGYRVTYFEIRNKSIEFARRIFSLNNVSVDVCSDLSESPADFFDAVVCLDVLEHVEDPPRVVGELVKHFRSEGLFFPMLHLCTCTQASAPIYGKTCDGAVTGNASTEHRACFRLMEHFSGIQSSCRNPLSTHLIGSDRFILKCHYFCRSAGCCSLFLVCGIFHIPFSAADLYSNKLENYLDCRRLFPDPPYSFILTVKLPADFLTSYRIPLHSMARDVIASTTATA